MVDILTLFVFADLKEPFTARSGVCGRLRLGERVILPPAVFTRKRKGRTEALQVAGVYRAEEVTVQCDGRVWSQVVKIASVGAAPSWRNIKNPLPRTLGPTSWKVTLDP